MEGDVSGDLVRTPKWLDKCHFGDCRDTMRAMIADGVKVQTIVTSPPYWGLRSYLPEGHPDKHLEIGQEPTLKDFIATMTDVFELCRQMLADDGTAWVNMGDAYAGSWGNQGREYSGVAVSALSARQVAASQRKRSGAGTIKDPGIKPKDMMGQPWRLAFALQDAGWYLRQDVIWHKPNPMPESVRDRCTKAHEYLFLLSKSEKYYFDQEAILEPVSPNTHARLSQNVQAQIGSARANGGAKTNGNMKAVGRTPAGWATGTDRNHDETEGRYTSKRKVYPGNGVGFGHGYDEAPKGRVKNNASFDEAMAIMPTERNRRSVWTISTQSYSGAHFATFPEALVEPCVLAGTKVGDIVFDPFFGSGTSGQVASRLGRRFIGCDLNKGYEPLQRDRLRQPGLVLEVIQ
jgi:site-specific DNA-methyltransferase (cytosine-N4-specific)